MKKEMIPITLRHLIPMVEKWGIEDDGYRDEAIEAADTLELNELISSISTKDANELDKWFCDPYMMKNPADEYIKYCVFFMSFEYAKAVLKSRPQVNTNKS